MFIKQTGYSGLLSFFICLFIGWRSSVDTRRSGGNSQGGKEIKGKLTILYLDKSEGKITRNTGNLISIRFHIFTQVI